MQTQLEKVYEHEAQRANDIWLTQPMGKSQLQEITWASGVNEARKMAAYLRSLDFPPGSKIAIFAKNNAWWLIADLAIWMAGYVSVPLYPVLTSDTIGQILDHSESRLIFIGKLDGFEAMEPGIPDALPRVLMPLAPATRGEAWREILERTEPITDHPKPDPDTLATLIYTSGSTGVPKGVMHSFRTMCAARAFVRELGITAEDRMLSYLPLAHSFERALVETTSLLTGFHVFFAESLETFVSDIQRARPTLFISVPRLWQKFQAGVSKKMPPKKLSLLLKIPIVRGIIRKKILDGLGLAEVRFAGTGSAPIPAEVVDWYRSLGLELLEGYGMTENFTISHMSRPGQMRVGYVGHPQEGVEQKISDDGEILVKSPGNMLGYYKAEDLTLEVLPEDGFLRTGDQGEIDAAGRLKITGRVKELFKTSKGKYVAPAPIENALLLHVAVEQVCVSGANKERPFAMIVLSEDLRVNLGRDREATSRDLTEQLETHLQATNAKLDQHEHLAKIVVIEDEWTPENGLLTPTMKLKRAAIESKYAPQVDGWYREKARVIWVG